MAGLRAFGIGVGGAAAIGVAATSVLSPLSQRVAAGRSERAKANPDDKPLQHPSDSLGNNLDGIGRLALGGIGLLALPVAAGAGMLGKGRFALGALGVSLGAAGAMTLGGTKPRSGEGIGDLAMRNLSSAGSTVNAFIHWHNQTDNPKVRDHIPREDAKPTNEPRPTGAELRAARLPLPGDANLEEAKRQADATLSRIDWSKPDIVVWVPGTGAHDLAGDWKAAAETAFGDKASLVHVDYPAATNFGPSVSTGMEAVRLVLAGIAEHDGNHRVTLAGHSQGAWVAGEVMSVPAVRGIVDRAFVVGHPGAAKHHYDDRRDPKVMELNDRGDGVTFPMVAVESFLGGMEQVERGDKLSGGVNLAETGVRNPASTAYLAAKYLQPDRWSGQADPHHYEELFPDAALWLAEPVTSASSDAPRPH